MIKKYKFTDSKFSFAPVRGGKPFFSNKLKYKKVDLYDKGER